MSAFASTGTLVRLALRRDRIQLPIWLYGLAFVLVGTAKSFGGLYPTVGQRREFATEIAANPGFRALYGQLYDPTSIGGLTAWRLAGNLALLLGLMNLLLVVRHTRGEEESGRAELVGAGAVGRYAPLAAALAVTGLADIVFACLAAAGLVAVGLPVAGSFALGLAIAASAWFFAAVAAVTAQIARTGRGAGGAAGAVLGTAYVLRAAGDSGGGDLAWLSPLAWAQRTRAFAAERWWLPGLAFVLSLGLAAAALLLVQVRDLGAGMLPDRAGPAEASRGLAGPLGLAWRLQRGVLLGWACGFAVLGAVLGGIAKEVGDLLAENPGLAEAFRRAGGGANLVDTYIASMSAVLGLAVGGYVVQATLRVRSEESGLRAEWLLAAPVGRWRWAASHVLCAAVGTVVALASAGVTMGLVHGLRVHDVGGEFPRLLRAALVQVPAAWVLGGLAVALIGLAPRLVSLAWAALGGCLMLWLLALPLDLPRWTLDVSPFAHTPDVPVAAVAPGPLAALAATALALTLGGLAGLRYRDIG